MAFDWRVFAEGIEKAADTLAGRLTYDWQQKQEEKRVMREYEAKSKLEEAQRIRELETTHKYQRDLAAHGSELDADRAIKLNEYEATLNQFFKSPELMNTVQTYLKSDNPDIKMMGNSTMALIAKIREGKMLSQDEHSFLMKSLPGNTFAPIADVIRTNQDRERNYEQQKTEMHYYDALAEFNKFKQKDGLDVGDISGVLQKVSNIDEAIAKLESSDVIVGVMGELERQGGDIGKLRPELRVVYMNHAKNVHTMRQTQAMLLSLLQKPGAQITVPGEIPTEEPGEEIPQEIPTEKKGEPTGKELASWIKGLHQKETERLEGRREEWEKKKEERELATTTPSRADVRQRYDIPKGVRIFTAKNLEDLKKLSGVKKNPPKTGDLVWTGESLHEIQVTDGKITISRKPWAERKKII